MGGRVTYVCEREGCDKTKSVQTSTYNKSEHHYCSTECRGLASRINRLEVPCTQCGTIIPMLRHRYENTNNHFHNNDCYRAHRKEHPELYYNTNNNKDNKITYTCEAEGCTNTKTIYKKAYARKKHHFCGLSCAGKVKGALGKGRTWSKKRRESHDKKKIELTFKERWEMIEWK